MPTDVEVMNDRIQGSTSRRECEAILAECSADMLRSLCDANHLDTDGTLPALRKRIMQDRHAYRPGGTYVGGASPQSNPELFTDEDLTAEIRYLLALNAKHGAHILRIQAYTKLIHVLAARRAGATE